MCPDCQKAKMLFESEKKAKNFIKWNGENIDTHGGELRPYYCPACCGWHITHKPHNEVYDHMTDNLIGAYKRLMISDDNTDKELPNKRTIIHKKRIIIKTEKKLNNYKLTNNNTRDDEDNNTFNEDINVVQLKTNHTVTNPNKKIIIENNDKNIDDNKTELDYKKVAKKISRIIHREKRISPPRSELNAFCHKISKILGWEK